jgi:hypothetical protein
LDHLESDGTGTVQRKLRHRPQRGPKVDWKPICIIMAAATCLSGGLYLTFFLDMFVPGSIMLLITGGLGVFMIFGSPSRKDDSQNGVFCDKSREEPR